MSERKLALINGWYNCISLTIDLYLSDAGIAYCLEDRACDYFRDSSLRIVLEE
ncbi:hypothetical protein [Klebsiella sp. RIT-PI-d]|uniref:hypothetical protein n=1 Tax=Klebsiella sp. RIT-PI-d TaxID=1681196 RepID=UPI000A8690D8|nr:hypothetical protein [Klebsiella sp. RIT-PI-d]